MDIKMWHKLIPLRLLVNIFNTRHEDKLVMFIHAAINCPCHDVLVGLSCHYIFFTSFSQNDFPH